MRHTINLVGPDGRVIRPPLLGEGRTGRSPPDQVIVGISWSTEIFGYGLAHPAPQSTGKTPQAALVTIYQAMSA